MLQKRGLPSPSVKWVHVFLWTFTRSILRTDICVVLGTGLKKQVAAAIIVVQKEGCQLQRMSAPSAVRSHRQSRRLHWLGQEGGRLGRGGGGHRSLNTRPSQGRSIAQAALGRSSGQEATSQRTQLWPVLGRGPCLGGFLVRACSQAAGRWSPLWASAQEVAFIECLLCARHRGRVTDQITPTPGIGPRSSWQEKQLLLTCGFPGAPRLQPAGMRRGVFGAFFHRANQEARYRLLLRCAW